MFTNSRQSLFGAIVAVVLLLTSCSEGARSPVQPSQLDLPLRFVLTPCNSNMTSEQCMRINKAIQHLRNHGDPMCKRFGENAYQRNKYEAYWYRYDPDFNAGSGGSWEPDQGFVWISQLGFANQGGTNLAGLSAHEEYHLLFPRDSTDDHALEWEAYCGAGFVG